MKRIPLRIQPDPLTKPGTPEYQIGIIRWTDVIRQVIRRPFDPQRGVDVEEMRKGIRVLDVVDACPPDSETLDLEDADWQHLVDKTKAMQWAVVDRRILAFINDVLNAGDGLIPNGQVIEAREVPIL